MSCELFQSIESILPPTEVYTIIRSLLGGLKVILRSGQILF